MSKIQYSGNSEMTDKIQTSSRGVIHYRSIRLIDLYLPIIIIILRLSINNIIFSLLHCADHHLATTLGSVPGYFHIY